MDYFKDSKELDELYDEQNAWWKLKKQDLLDNIEKAIERQQTDPEVLELMKDLVNQAKVRKSMEEYFNEEDL